VPGIEPARIRRRIDVPVRQVETARPTQWQRVQAGIRLARSAVMPIRKSTLGAATILLLSSLPLALAQSGCANEHEGASGSTGRADVRSLKRFPAIQTDITLTDPSAIQQFIDESFHGMLLVASHMGADGTLHLTVDDQVVDVPLIAGATPEQTGDAIKEALEPLGFDVRNAAHSVGLGEVEAEYVNIESREGLRSGPVRNFGELAVVFRAIEIVEKQGKLLKFNPGGQVVFLPAFAGCQDGRCRENLQNYLELGTSSLTRYEVGQLVFGLNLLGPAFDAGGSHFRGGDRVRFTDASGTHRGIVAGVNGQDDVFILAKDAVGNTGFKLAQVTEDDIDALIAGVLIDGKRRP
jgi:hypothetical protein